MKAVQIVTIKSKSPLYKGSEVAERIELVNLEEVGFDLISAKDTHKIGSKAVFIQPDFCLPDTELFSDFIRPGGDEKKSMLGKVEGLPRRIRAKKFNFSKSEGGDVVYSNGILLPYSEVCDFLGVTNLEILDLDEKLSITKYEEPENTQGKLNVGRSSSFPQGVYKTDESNIFNKLGQIKFPATFQLSEKDDGSSITFGFISGKPIVCSRNLQKPLTYTKRVGVRKKTFWEKLMFWKKVDLTLYEEVSNDKDDFVKYATPYLNKLEQLKAVLSDNILFRGELRGKSLKGSGNKNNPARHLENDIAIYDINLLNPSSNQFEKVNLGEFNKIIDVTEFKTVKQLGVKTFESFQEIIDYCNDYFKSSLIEGIVIKTLDAKFSAKVMNLEYDSKK